MSALMNQQILLNSRPITEPTKDNFAFVKMEIPEPGIGEVLSRTIYLSLDPYMRGRMIKGFLVGDYQARQAEFIRDMTEWLQAGRIKYKEDIVQGLENAPDAFIGLLQGKNFGKLIVQVDDDPTKQ